MNERLRWARQRAGYSDAASAARRFHWSVPTYRAHENGTRNFKMDAARRYAEKFRVRAEWLVFGQGEPETDRRRNESKEADVTAAEFVERLAKLSPQGREKVLQYLADQELLYAQAQRSRGLDSPEEDP